MTEMPLIKVASPQIEEEDLGAVREALLSGQLISGPRVAAFEKAFAAHVGTKDAVAVNSGTAALHAALAAAGVGPGDEVIVPALTFFSTVAAVIHQGGVPVFADISPVSFSMDPEDVALRITPRTRALLPVHYFGHAADMDGLCRLASEHGLAIVEDCAQSHGTTFRGVMTGAIGDFGAFSFFATKHMTTGEGGIVTTNSPEHAAFMRRFRSHGMEGRNDHVMLGYNYRMQEANAALGSSQLRRLERTNAARIAVSEKVIERVRGIPWLRVPQVPAHIRHTYFWCHVWIDEDLLSMRTSSVIARLRELGIEVRNRYEEPLYRQPVMTTNIPPLLRLVAGKHLPDYGRLFLPNAERIAGRVIGLPNRPDLTDSEIERVVSALLSLSPRRQVSSGNVSEFLTGES